MKPSAAQWCFIFLLIEAEDRNTDDLLFFCCTPQLCQCSLLYKTLITFHSVYPVGEIHKAVATFMFIYSQVRATEFHFTEGDKPRAPEFTRRKKTHLPNLSCCCNNTALLSVLYVRGHIVPTILMTSAKEVMFSPVLVHLFVCQQDYQNKFLM